MTKPNEQILNRLENKLSASEAMEVLTICNEYIESERKKIKVKAVKSYCKMIENMRDEQKRYFQTKSRDALKEAKKLEKQIDNVIEKVLK